MAIEFIDYGITSVLVSMKIGIDNAIKITNCRKLYLLGLY